MVLEPCKCVNRKGNVIDQRLVLSRCWALDWLKTIPIKKIKKSIKKYLERSIL